MQEVQLSIFTPEFEEGFLRWSVGPIKSVGDFLLAWQKCSSTTRRSGSAQLPFGWWGAHTLFIVKDAKSFPAHHGIRSPMKRNCFNEFYRQLPPTLQGAVMIAALHHCMDCRCPVGCKFYLRCLMEYNTSIANIVLCGVDPVNELLSTGESLSEAMRMNGQRYVSVRGRRLNLYTYPSYLTVWRKKQ